MNQAEKDLGPLCLEAVRKFGGVLEHPAGSALLPPPGCGRDRYGGLTFVVDQAWFGFPARKRTLLYVVGVDELPAYPLDLAYPRRRVEDLTGEARSFTTPQMASWLIAIARHSTKCPCVLC